MPYVNEPIPLWAQDDIDKWMAHSANQSLEEAKGSHEYFTLLAYEGGKVIAEGTEVDTILIIWRVEGVTFIKCYGDSDVQLYVGTMEGLHQTYIAYPEDKEVPLPEPPPPDKADIAVKAADLAQDIPVL